MLSGLGQIDRAFERDLAAAHPGSFNADGLHHTEPGKTRFAAFIDIIERRLAAVPTLDCRYRTRIWMVRSVTSVSWP